MRVETLGLCNSGDTAGPKDRVVGYGAWAFFEPATPRQAVPLNIRVTARQNTTPHDNTDFEKQTKQLLADHGPRLLGIADASIRFGLANGRPLPIDPAAEAAPLAADGASFVTLKTTQKQLRGCIGSAAAYQPLAKDVAENAFKAAFKDPRFKPVTAAEFESLRLSISVLSPQAPMTFRDEVDFLSQLRPGVDGLLIVDGAHRALFLPSVWEQLPTPQVFLAQLKRKAGMAPDHWSPQFRANRFIAEEIHAAR